MGINKEQQPTPSKVWYKSTTIWLNVLGLVIFAIQYGLNFQVIPMEYQEAALAVLNVLNRFKTATAVTL